MIGSEICVSGGIWLARGGWVSTAATVNMDDLESLTVLATSLPTVDLSEAYFRNTTSFSYF